MGTLTDGDGVNARVRDVEDVGELDHDQLGEADGLLPNVADTVAADKSDGRKLANAEAGLGLTEATEEDLTVGECCD